VKVVAHLVWTLVRIFGFAILLVGGWYLLAAFAKGKAK